jgi:hypothetical protein
VKDKEKAQRYTHLSLMSTNLVYLTVMVISTIYFSKEQLLKTIWATLSLLKIIQFSFLERFEYIAIPLWMLIVLPVLLLQTWALTRGMKRLFSWNQKVVLYVLCTIIFIASILLKKRGQVNNLNDLLSLISIYVDFIYPFILLLLVKLIHAIRKQRARRRQS